MTGPELKLPTTVGTCALEYSMAKRNAPVVDTVTISLSLNPLNTISSVLIMTSAGRSRRNYSWEGKPLGKSNGQAFS